jgi:hypothetical protein
MQNSAIQITAPCRARQNKGSKGRARMNAIVKWYLPKEHTTSQCEEPSSTRGMHVGVSVSQIERCANLLASDLLRLPPEVQAAASFAHPTSRLLRKHDRHEMVQALTVS